MRALTFLAVAVAVLGVAAMSTELGHHHDCLHACKKFTETSVPGCKLEGDGCKCIFHHKYRVTFTDPTTGVSFESGWGSQDQAGYDAINVMGGTSEWMRKGHKTTQG